MRGMLAARLSVLTAGWLLAAGLSFSAPPGWKSTPPSSSMRVAEFTLPRANGDTDDAELVVYYFGGSGGSVEANVQRWIAQMQQPDGKPSAAVARRETRHVNGLTIALVDVSGTYVAETAPGAATHHNNPGYRLRAGVVDTPAGPYYIKLTGPQRTVARWEKAFDDFLASMRVK
jgi:hypothetical protein